MLVLFMCYLTLLPILKGRGGGINLTLFKMEIFYTVFEGGGG